MPCPVQYLGDVIGRAMNRRFYRSVSAVSHPARHPQAVSLHAHIRTIPYALNSAMDDEMFGYFHGESAEAIGSTYFTLIPG